MRATVLMSVCLLVYAVAFVQSQGTKDIFKDVLKCFENKDLNVMKKQVIQGFKKCALDMKNILPCMMSELQLSESEKSCFGDVVKKLNLGGMMGGR
ncbi:unnamed protein product [Ixodes pacificus]